MTEIVKMRGERLENVERWGGEGGRGVVALTFHGVHLVLQ